MEDISSIVLLPAREILNFSCVIIVNHLPAYNVPLFVQDQYKH